MKKIAETMTLPPEPTQGMKVIAQVLTTGGWWKTHLAWVKLTWETERGAEVTLETTEGKTLQHPWAQTWWSRVEAVEA
jgi:hypothetical protein